MEKISTATRVNISFAHKLTLVCILLFLKQKHILGFIFQLCFDYFNN